MSEFFPTVDQASGLRRLFEKQATPVVAVASTQRDGGRMSARVRVMMQIVDDLLAAGRTLTLLDEHSEPGGISQAYGVRSRRDLKHALHGAYPLDEVTFRPAPGLALIPASRVAGMEFTLADAASLAGNLALLKSRSDCVMIDCAHRAQQALSPIAAGADQLLVVTAGSGDDLTRAYSLIKRAALEKAMLPISVVVVHATDASSAKATYDKLRRVAFDHLGIRLHYQGAALTPGVKRLSLMRSTAVDSRGMASMDKQSGMAGRRGMADSMV